MARYLQDGDIDVMPGSPDEDDEYDEYQRQMQAVRTAPPTLSSAPRVVATPPFLPNDQDSVAPAPVSPKALPEAPPPGADYTALERAYDKMPVPPKPKWWQRAAGAAAGFGAGWSNAASRTRNPINIDEMRQDILAPGYARDMAEWQARVAPLEKKAELETARQGAWWKNKQIQAQSDYYKAHADYMEGLGRGAYIDVTPEMERVTDGALKQGTKVPAGTVNEALRVAAGKYNKPLTTFPVKDPDLAKRMGVPVGTEVPIEIYKAAMKPSAAAKPLIVSAGGSYLDPDTGEVIYHNTKEFAPERGRAGGGRGAGPATQFKQVEQTKSARLLRARQDAAKKLATASSDDRQAILDQLTDQEQVIQNSYENEVARLGGEPEHWEVPQESLQNFPGVKAEKAEGTPATTGATTTAPAKPAPAAIRPAYSEAQIRQAAIARGKDPDKAVAHARQTGMLR